MSEPSVGPTAEQVVDLTAGPVPDRPSMSGIGVASAAAAVLTWLLHVAAGHALGVRGYAHFMVVWGLFFTVTGVLQGLQQEVTRSVAATRGTAGATGARPVVGALVVGVAGALLVVASGPLWAPGLLGRQWWSVTGVIAGGVAAYALANQINGALAGREQWRLYAGAILLEGVLRAALVLTVLLVATSATWWATGLVGGVLAWALLAGTDKTRRALLARGDEPTGRFLVKAGQAMLAAGCSALVVSGFPVLLDLVTRGDLGPDAGVVLAVLVATRAPVLLFLNAYQGVLITRLVKSASPTHLLARWSAGGLALAVPAAGVAYSAGPSLLRLVFGAGFVASGGLFAAVVASTGALALLTLTGWTTLAIGEHAWFVAGWLLATVATTAVLLLPLGLAERASLALLLGPLAGVGCHLTAMRRGAHATDLQAAPTGTYSA